MQKLILQCRRPSEMNQMKDQIEARLPYQVHPSYSGERSLELISTINAHLIVLDVGRYDEKAKKLIQQVRQGGFNHPILLLSQEFDLGDLPQLNSQYKTQILPKPADYRAIVGVIRQLLTKKKILQQRHRRFRTQQNALIETFTTGEHKNSNMYNLSQGGAYCEFRDRFGLSAGDLVRLSVGLDNPSRHYSMKARVVWTTHKGRFSGGPGVGLRFLGSHELLGPMND